MKRYTFYSRIDAKKESYGCIISFSRLAAARLFSEKKRLPLKEFLKIYEVSR